MKGDKRHRAIAGLSWAEVERQAMHSAIRICIAAYAMSALMNIPVSGEEAGKTRPHKQDGCTDAFCAGA